MANGITSTFLRWLDVSDSALAKARLRTKLLLSLTLLIAALTFATLAVVGHAAQDQVRTAVEKDARNSVLTFQNLRDRTPDSAGARRRIAGHASRIEGNDGG